MVAGVTGDHSQMAQLSLYFFFFAAFFLAMILLLGLWLGDYT